MGSAIDELKKTKEAWEKQKNNKLVDARIADAYINATQAAIELIEEEKPKKKTDSS